MALKCLCECVYVFNVCIHLHIHMNMLHSHDLLFLNPLSERKQDDFKIKQRSLFLKKT